MKLERNKGKNYRKERIIGIGWKKEETNEGMENEEKKSEIVAEGSVKGGK